MVSVSNEIEKITLTIKFIIKKVIYLPDVEYIKSYMLFLSCDLMWDCDVLGDRKCKQCQQYRQIIYH